jgi:hypothetical protein
MRDLRRFWGGPRAAECAFWATVWATHGTTRSGRSGARLTVEFFTYTDEQWNDIRTVERDELDLDAEQIERHWRANSRSPQALGE